MLDYDRSICLPFLNLFFSITTLFLTFTGMSAAALILPHWVFLCLILPRAITLVLLFATREKLTILWHRYVLDHGKNRRSRAALGTVDVRRSARLVHRVYRRLPADCQVHSSFRLLATERGSEQAVLRSHCRGIRTIWIPLCVPFAAGWTNATFFPKDGIVHPIRKRLVLQILRVQPLRQGEFVNARVNLWNKRRSFYIRITWKKLQIFVNIYLYRLSRSFNSWLINYI